MKKTFSVSPRTKLVGERIEGHSIIKIIHDNKLVHATTCIHTPIAYLPGGDVSLKHFRKPLFSEDEYFQLLCSFLEGIKELWDNKYYLEEDDQISNGLVSTLLQKINEAENEELGENPTAVSKVQDILKKINKKMKKRMYYHERKIYPDPRERKIARRIRNERESFYLATPFARAMLGKAEKFTNDARRAQYWTKPEDCTHYVTIETWKESVYRARSTGWSHEFYWAKSACFNLKDLKELRPYQVPKLKICNHRL